MKKLTVAIRNAANRNVTAEYAQLRVNGPFRQVPQHAGKYSAADKPSSGEERSTLLDIPAQGDITEGWRTMPSWQSRMIGTGMRLKIRLAEKPGTSVPPANGGDQR